MKNTIFRLLIYLYYFSLAILLILYLFPGSLIGYLLYGNLGQQPDLISNPIGTSINHLIFFGYITLFAFIIRSRTKNIFTNFKTLIILSIILELLHTVVPNRAFETYDLIANVLGVIIILILQKILKWPKLS
tara:strand:+ start:59 stop:454 length:396 start_codon:yes stop_codon:yes gene_type:complete